MPKATNTSGPTQHTDAPIAANAPAINVPLWSSWAIVESLNMGASSSILNPVLRYGIKGKVMAADLTIGKLASAAGVNLETIRYYQRRGLLEEPAKPYGGHRRYPAGVVKRVRFIKRAQALGFTLTEIAGLLGLEEARACAETRDLASRKLTLIEDKMADLAAMRQALADLLRQCDRRTKGGTCPIIQTL